MEAVRLYDTSAVVELLAVKGFKVVPGVVSILTVVEYPPAAGAASEILYPTKRDYALAVKWQVELRKSGSPLPAVDLVIAASAFNNGLTLVTLDKHFEVLKKVEPRLVIEMSI